MDPIRTLQGDDWLGHPVHPALVAGPIGMWVFSLVMDGIASVTHNECAEDAANYAVTAGLLAAGLSAVTGLADYNRVPDDEPARSDAFTHGALNATATVLYGLNAAMRAGRRKSGKRTGLLPKLLSLAGVGIIGYTGWLGGELAYNKGIGVSERRGEKIERRRRERTVEPSKRIYREEVEPKAGV